MARGYVRMCRFIDDIRWFRYRYKGLLFILWHPSQDSGPSSLLKEDILRYVLAIRTRMEAL